MTPFKSKDQMAYMYANHPKIAKRWSKEYPQDNNLPKKLSKKLRKKTKAD